MFPSGDYRGDGYRAGPRAPSYLVDADDNLVPRGPELALES